jgi:hypothetical protein
MYTSICRVSIHVRSRSCNEVDAGLLSGLDERFDVAEAREVDAGATFGLVQTPKGVKRDCVQSDRLDLLEDVQVQSVDGHSRARRMLVKFTGHEA